MNYLLSQSYDVYAAICAISVLIALFVRDTKWFVYSSLVCVFMFVGWVSYGLVKSFETSLSYRYFYYSFCELIFIIILFKLWDRNWIRHEQYFFSLVLSTLLISLWLGRYIDRHYLDLTYTNGIYKLAIQSINGMYAISCILPAFTLVKYERILNAWKR